MKRKASRAVEDNGPYQGKPSVGEVLEKYISQGLHPYTQIDGFAGLPASSAMPPDKDGYCLARGKTWEMMATSPAIRILIPPDADPKDVRRLLMKALLMIEKDPDCLKWLPPDPCTSAVTRFN